jgi:hypothetical protein
MLKDTGAALAVAVVGLMLLPTGCGESTEEGLRRRLSETKDELSTERRMLGRAESNLGACEAQRESLNKMLTDLRSEVGVLKGLSNDQQTVTEYLQKRDELHEALQTLKEKVSTSGDLPRRIKDLEKEKGALERRVQDMTGENESLRTDMDDLRELANTGGGLIDELNEQRALNALLAEEHPAFIITLLQRRSALTDDDLLNWNSLDLKYHTPAWFDSEIIQLTVPLSILDHRGTFLVQFGQLQFPSESVAIDLETGVAVWNIPNASALQEAVKLSNTKEATVLFGPSTARSAIVFSLVQEAGKVDLWQASQIRLAGLPVAKRASDGIWQLTE